MTGPETAPPTNPETSPKTGPGPNPPIRVLLADDQALLRGSLRILIDATDGMVAVGEAGTGAEAVDLTRARRPDLVLMDVQMPGGDGIEATRAICADPDTAATRVLVLTTFDLDEYVYAALRAGASGFMLKNAPPVDLLNAVRVIAAGDALLAPSVTRRLIAEFAAHPPSAPPGYRASGGLDGVTARETEVLALIAAGMSNPEIAEYLGVGVTTVKTHVGHLLTKLGARDRAHLVIAAYESGTVRVGVPGAAAPERRAGPGRGPRPRDDLTI